MSIAQKVQEILNERKRDVLDQIDDLASDVRWSMSDEERANINMSEIRKITLETMRDFFASMSLLVDEESESRSVIVNIAATTKVIASSPQHLENILIDIREEALSFGCENVQLTADYSASPIAPTEVNIDY